MTVFHVSFKKETGLDPIGIDCDGYNFEDRFVNFIIDGEDNEKEYTIASFNTDLILSIVGDDGKHRITYGNMCFL